MWESHVQQRTAPEAKFYLPGPGQYESKHYMRDDPSFGTAGF